MVASANPADWQWQASCRRREVDENLAVSPTGATMVAAAADWKTFAPAGEIEHFLAGGKYDAKEYALAQRVQAEALADPNLVAKWKAGNPKAAENYVGVFGCAGSRHRSRAMKFACEFINPITRERRVVVVDVSDELGGGRIPPTTTWKFHEHVFALVRGYREARGFAHTGTAAEAVHERCRTPPR